MRSTGVQQRSGSKGVAMAAEGGAAIPNLDESYFKRPMSNLVHKYSKKSISNPANSLKLGTGPRTANSGICNPSQQRMLANKKDNSMMGGSKAGEDECSSCSSETTPHHSNKSTMHTLQPGATAKHDKRALSRGKLGGSAGTARPEAESKKPPVETVDVAYDADLQRAMAESLEQHRSEHGLERDSSKGDVVVLVDSEEEEEEERANAQYDEDAQLKEAIRLSLKDSEKAQHYSESQDRENKSEQTHHSLTSSDSREDGEAKFPAEDGGRAQPQSSTQHDEDTEMEEAFRLSLEESKKVQQYSESQDSEHRSEPTYRSLTKHELENVVDAFVDKQGGFEEIEGGKLIKRGNANSVKKSCVAAGGGRNQTGAEYGRYSMQRFWRVFDVLEGRADVNSEETERAAVAAASRLDPKKAGKGKAKRELERNQRLQGLPGAKIKAFLDIGHGMGIQVLQAGWGPLRVPSRGVELMRDRHFIAESIRGGVLESLRNDPPDSNLVQLELSDFSLAMVPDKETNRRDERLRRFLLFHDMPQEVQEGLVIFINNAEGVFGARSNQKTGGAFLDCHLATLFANMQIGGRMVTLWNISSYLSRSSAWFCGSGFQSGTNAVSWGNENKSVEVHVLTKLSNEWCCQNKTCGYLGLGRGQCPNPIVDEEGNLWASCWSCGAAAERCSRLRNSSVKRRKGGK